MATLEKYARLMDLLYMQTTAGKLKWEQDPFSNEFSVTLPPYSISLAYGENSDGNDVVVCHLRNDAGHIDSFNDEDLGSFQPADFESYWPLMRELFSMARRSASGADKAIDDILGALDRINTK